MTADRELELALLKVAAFRATRGDTDTTHGCDGCCRPS